MKIVELDIEGMHCEGCASRVEAALSSVDGVARVRVALDRGVATIEGSGLDRAAMIEAVEGTGYGASTRE